MNADIWRTVECQAKWSLRNHVSGDLADLSILEEFVFETKPEKVLELAFQRLGYHILIYTQFLYPLPVPPEKVARFRPADYHKNVFYGALDQATSLYEAAYYFMRERVRINSKASSAEPKTLFQVAFTDTNMLDISQHSNVCAIMDRQNYSASHDFMRQNTSSSILYPSARHNSGKCLAIFEISRLGKSPLLQVAARFTFENPAKVCRVEIEGEEAVRIAWQEIS